MNRIEQPPVIVGAVGHDADDVDVMLRQYFQAELPRAWTAPPTPMLPFRPLRRTGRSWRSRFTLAASVAGLLLGSAWFAARAPEPAPSNTPGIQEATRRHSLQEPPAPETLILPDSRGHR